jgi:hypothetical protein
MTDRPSDMPFEARLNSFLAAELRRAEADFSHLPLRRPRTRSASGPLGLALLALVASVLLVPAWGALPQGTAGGDPLGADGIPLSIGGEPVLRGADIDSHLAYGSSFLAGGYLVLHPALCESASSAPSTGCGEDWRLEDAVGNHSVRVTTVGGGANFVRTSGAASVFRVKPVVDEVSGGLGTANRKEAVLIEAVPWRQPTKGPIPEEATRPEGGEINMALVPDFVSTLGGPTGEAIVGYVPKGILLGPRSVRGGTPQNPPQDIPMPVYGEDLTTLIGHMVAGQGFVPLGSSAAPSVLIGSPSTGPSADPWGPLAVIPPEGGADTARTEGTLRITDECVFLEAQGEAPLLFWPADRTTWDGEARAITFRNFDKSVVTVSDGDHVVLGGSGDSEADSGTSGEDWVKQVALVAQPAPSCVLDPRWVVGAVGR